MTTTTNPLPNIPFPSGASLVDCWVDVHLGKPSRYFEMPRTLIPCNRGDVAVFVAGFN
jgi:hypothetical protein